MPSPAKESQRAKGPEPKRRGAPRGNRNALKHGFYSAALKEAEKLSLQEAQDIEGLDDEIAVLRFKLRQLLQKAPNNIPLQVQVIRTLAHLLATKYKLPTGKKRQVFDAALEAIKSIGIPIGISSLLKGDPP